MKRNEPAKKPSRSAIIPGEMEISRAAAQPMTGARASASGQPIEARHPAPGPEHYAHRRNAVAEIVGNHGHGHQGTDRGTGLKCAADGKAVEEAVHGQT